MPSPEELHILVLVDNPRIAELVHTAIEDTEGVDAESVSTIKEADAFLEQHPIQVLVADVELSNGESSLGFMKDLRKRGKDIFISAFSANPNNADVAFDAGANEFIEAPFEPLDTVIQLPVRVKLWQADHQAQSHSNI